MHPENLRIENRTKLTKRAVASAESEVVGGWVANSNSRCDGVWVFHRGSIDEWSGAVGLKTPHLRNGLDYAEIEIFEIALEIGRVDAGVANRKHVDVWRITETLDNFECGGFLTLDAVWVNRVDQVHGVVFA